jgi:protein-disulfide isomerase
MKSVLETTFTAVLVVCALVLTGLFVRREFFPPPSPSPEAMPESDPVLLTNWREHLATGERIGAADAPLQVIEFGDYECPYCAQFHKEFEGVRQRYIKQVALTYIHLPLPMHRFAEPAARAAECAGAQGRFEAMHDRLYEHQNEFGIKPWTEMAKESGVPDVAAFEDCIGSQDASSLVSKGKQLATTLNIQGTPTLIVNGWMLGRPPTAAELEDMVKAVLAGRAPVTTKS